MLSIATNKIILRDNFKVLPMPASIIQILNQLAAKIGRYLSRIPNVYNEIQYTRSVDKSMMPRFMLIQPPNPEQRLRADVQESPAILQLSQSILTDIPQEEFAIPPDIGGDLTTLTQNISELGPEETVQSSPPDNMVSSVDTSQHITDTPDSDVLTDPPGGCNPPSPSPTC